MCQSRGPLHLPSLYNDSLLRVKGGVLEAATNFDFSVNIYNVTLGFILMAFLGNSLCGLTNAFDYHVRGSG